MKPGIICTITATGIPSAIDIDPDGDLNLSDGISSLKVQAGMADETINIYADLNNDGKIDQVEAQHAL